MPPVRGVSRPPSRPACGDQGTRADVPGIGCPAPAGPVSTAQTLYDTSVARTRNCSFTRGRSPGDLATCRASLGRRNARQRRPDEPRPLAHAWTSDRRTVIGPAHGEAVV